MYLDIASANLLSEGAFLDLDFFNGLGIVADQFAQLQNLAISWYSSHDAEVLRRLEMVPDIFPNLKRLIISTPYALPTPQQVFQRMFNHPRRYSLSEYMSLRFAHCAFESTDSLLLDRYRIDKSLDFPLNQNQFQGSPKPWRTI